MLTRNFLKIFPLCFALIALVLFVADAKTILVDESDDSSHICMYTGDILTIRLVSNPTTGYSWTNTDSPSNLELLSSKSTPGQADTAGAPGYQTYSFKATKPDQSTLILNYIRPFEKNTPPAKRFRLSITVEERPAFLQASSAKP